MEFFVQHHQKFPSVVAVDNLMSKLAEFIIFIHNERKRKQMCQWHKICMANDISNSSINAMISQQKFNEIFKSRTLPTVAHK